MPRAKILELGSGLVPSTIAVDNTFLPVSSLVEGIIYHVPLNSSADFSAAIWKGVTYTLGDLSQSLAHIATRNALGWGKTTSNFVRTLISGASPYDLWDNTAMDSMVANYTLAAAFANAAGSTGVAMDTEPYNNQWTYDLQPAKGSHTLAATATRAYDLGVRVAAGIRGVSLNIDVLTFFAYEGYAGRIAGGTPSELNEYYLYRYFLDGMLDSWGALPGGTGKLILSMEGSYRCNVDTCITRYAYPQLIGTFDPVIPPADVNYSGGSVYFNDRNVTRRGLSIWLTSPLVTSPRSGDFNPATPEANYFTPALFKQMMDVAVPLVDYYWIYTDTPTIQNIGASYTPILQSQPKNMTLRYNK